MGGSSDQTIGFRYFMGLHMAICHGPVTSVNKLLVGKRNPSESGTGIDTPTSVNVSYNIFAPNLFGGEDKEGGVVGVLDIEMGTDTQTQNPYLAATLGGLVSGFRGVTCAVFRADLSVGGIYTSAGGGGYVTAISPYPKPWAFEVTDIPGGTFNPSKQNINSGSSNGGHIIYDCLTDAGWGLGHSAALLDAPSFTAATDTLFDENFGLSMIFAQQSSMEEFINLVLNHINGVLYTDRQTGLFVLRLIRDDYDEPSLPIFDETNINSMISFERPAFAEMVNEITLNYRVRGALEDTSITAQELASVQAQGGIVSQKLSFEGIDSNDLAAIVAQRELKQLSTPLARVRIVANREAWNVNPGDAIKLSWANYGVVQIILRVISVDYGTLENGLVGIDAVEDVFGLPTNSYLAPSDTGWADEVAPPTASPNSPTREMPYFVSQTTFNAAFLATLTDADCFLQMTAENPTVPAFNGKLITRTGADDFEEVANGQFSTVAQLFGSLDETTKLTIPIKNIVGGVGQIVIGGYAYLNSEVLRVDSVDAVGGLMDVGRGFLDSVPQSHSLDDIIYFADAHNLEDPTIYSDTDDIDAKVLPQTSVGILDEGDASQVSLIMAGRRAKPYIASQIRIDGVYFPAAMVDSHTISVTWEYQDRLQQLTFAGDDWYDTALGSPEAGTTYTVRFYRVPSTLLNTQSGLTGKIANFTPPDAVGVTVTLRVELEAVRSGLISTLFSHEFDYTKPGIVTGDLVADDAIVAGTVIISHPAITGTVVADDAIVEGAVSIIHPAITGTVVADDAIVAGEVTVTP